ncbi:MAG: ABC transporter permease [Acidimicrobiales bacterium]
MNATKGAVLGLAIVTLVVLAAIGAPCLAGHHPNRVVGPRLAPASLDHPLGTDEIGRDEWSRVLFGARTSLSAAGAAAAAVLVVGVAAGIAAGYGPRWFDSLLMRCVDAILACPNLVLVIAIAALVDPGISGLLLSLVAVWWVRYARIVRGLVRTLRSQDFVVAQRAAGAGALRISARTLLPNVASTVVVILSLEIGKIILAISALSFLGLGPQPPTAEWGAMINEGRGLLFTDARLMLVPGVAISLTVLGFNLLGDGLRDALDPRSHLDRAPLD